MRLTLWIASAALVLSACGDDELPALRGEFADDVEQCRAQLDVIYHALRAHHERTGALPAERDARFLAALIWGGELAEGEDSAALLSCPGADLGARAASLAAHADQWSDEAAVRGDWSAYAVRDLEAYPLEQFPSGGREPEPLLACDNANGMNHAGLLNLLRADGSIVTYDLAEEIAQGRLPAGSEHIQVGPDSPYAELRKLRAGRED